MSCRYLQMIEINMAIAEKIPAMAWPLINTEIYLGGNFTTRPNRLPCNTAANTKTRKE